MCAQKPDTKQTSSVNPGSFHLDLEAKVADPKKESKNNLYLAKMGALSGPLKKSTFSEKLRNKNLLDNSPSLAPKAPY